MSLKLVRQFLDRCDDEGVYSTCIDYSDWEDLKDIQLKHLIDEFKLANKNLLEYIGEGE